NPDPRRHRPYPDPPAIRHHRAGTWWDGSASAYLRDDAIVAAGLAEVQVGFSAREKQPGVLALAVLGDAERAAEIAPAFHLGYRLARDRRAHALGGDDRTAGIRVGHQGEEPLAAVGRRGVYVSPHAR